jgi:membrane-associated phospholipid phosphatase
MKYNNFIKKQVNDFWRDVTSLGSMWFVFLILFVVFFVDKMVALRLLISFILVELVGAVIKALFHKKRPNKQKFKNTLEKIDAGSFPSVHSAMIVVVAFSLWNIFPIKSLLLVIVLLVGASRIFLKKHYIIDVIGGYILGLLISYGSTFLIETFLNIIL